MNDEQDLIPDTNTPQENISAEENLSDDELRYAPRVEREVVAEDTPIAPAALEEDKLSVTDGLDIEAALAAVSSLSDMVAEQEAAEQARLARAELDAQLQAERQARLEHPERFFPVPPLTVLHRGQMTSVIPAIIFILVGAWLTFSLTASKTIPDVGLLAVVGAGGIAVTFLIRWLGSGRWARGSLFIALALLLWAVVGFYLIQTSSPGVAQGWPLFVVTLGLAVILTALLSQPREWQLVLPGLILIVAGSAGLMITLRILSENFVTVAASLWPVAVVVIAVVWLLPVIFRQRQ